MTNNNFTIPKYIFIIHHGQTEYQFYKHIIKDLWDLMVEESVLERNLINTNPYFYSLNKGESGITVDNFISKLEEKIDINVISRYTSRRFDFDLEKLDKYKISISILVFIDFNESGKPRTEEQNKIMSIKNEIAKELVEKLDSKGRIIFDCIKVIHSDKTIESSLKRFNEFSNTLPKGTSKPKAMEKWGDYIKENIPRSSSEIMKELIPSEGKENNHIEIYEFFKKIIEDFKKWLEI